MNRLSIRNSNQGMTLLEVLVVILVTILAISLIVPMRGPRRAPISRCFTNVKQIDLGLLMYADDNSGKFPIQDSITNNGVIGLVDRNPTFPYFQKLSVYIRYMPTFVCPADKYRKAAPDYEHLKNTNLSYFLDANVPTNRPAKSIMSGDRHLAANGQPLGHGTFALNTNMNLAWTRELHRNVGVLGFADGHVEINREPNLNPILQQQGLATLHLSIP